MDAKILVASSREEGGKGAARRLRALGQIPAVAYGAGKPARSVAVSPKALREVLDSEFGKNCVIELDVQGEGKLAALVSEYQYHPLSRALLHADFLLINLNETVDVEVPLELHGKAAGVVVGGTLRQVFRKLPVRCLPKDIPVKLTLDVSGLQKDHHLSVKDLILPEGVSVRLPDNRTVAAVVSERRRDAEEAAEAAAAAAPAEAGKAAAAKPAAGKAPAAKPGKPDAK